MKSFSKLNAEEYHCLLYDQVTSACQAGALNLRSEASIIGCLSLLIYVVPNMLDKILLDVLPASCTSVFCFVRLHPIQCNMKAYDNIFLLVSAAVTLEYILQQCRFLAVFNSS